MKRIALVGLSGVGKSTYLHKLATSLDFTHLEASKLIKEARKAAQKSDQTSEQLRVGKVLDNQVLLIEGFKKKASKTTGLTILDGHTIIDTGDKLIRIPALVFKSMHIEALFYLYDEPDQIQIRRISDTSRQRPHKSVAEIAHQQDQALLTAERIAFELKIPIKIITHKDISLNVDAQFLN